MKNLIGYLIAFVLEYTMVSYVFHFIACIISLAIGSFVMLMGLINDLNDNLEMINENVKSNATHLQIACQLYSFVQFHSEAKQLSLRIPCGAIRIFDNKIFFYHFLNIEFLG